MAVGGSSGEEMLRMDQQAERSSDVGLFGGTAVRDSAAPP